MDENLDDLKKVQDVGDLNEGCYDLQILSTSFNKAEGFLLSISMT